MDDVFDPDAYLAQMAPAQPQAATEDTSGFDPDSYIANAQEEKYGGLGQQIIAGVEGVASGIAGPLAPLVETAVLGVKPEDIRGREEANPITSGIGEAAGLTAGLLTGTGQAAIMTKAGKLAMDAVKLAKASEAASLGYKVGSVAVQQAAEMAVLQGGDEVAKLILQDPDQTSSTVISNMGLATVLGGLGGAAFGAAGPLWTATAGPKVESLLNMVKNHANGGSKLVMPEAREQAVKTLGIEVDPILRAAISDDAKMRSFFSDLRRGERKEVFESLSKLNDDTSNAVANALKLSPDDVLTYDANKVGHDLLDTFKKEYTARYQPVAEALERRNAEAMGVSLSDDLKLNQYNKLIERGMTEVLPGSEAADIYKKYAERLLPLDNIGMLDKLRTELYDKASTLGKDKDIAKALRDIRNQLGEFQEQVITKSAKEVASEIPGVSGKGHGVRAGQKEVLAGGEAMLAERQAANKSYREFAGMSDELSSHLGTGEFRGFGALSNKLENKLTPEQLLKRFSVRNNADLIPFLEKHFPQTLEAVLNNERQNLIRPAVLSAAKKGETPIDIKRLADIIDKQMAERSSYVDKLIPQEARAKVEAAKTLLDAIPTPRDSGTPAGLAKIFQFVPTSALAAVGWMTGHNPLFSAMVGHTAVAMGKGMPEAYKLAYLKFMGSTQGTSSAGFKAMSEFFHATYKGENALNKTIGNIFKPGAQVLAVNMISSDKDREKLDKMVDRSIRYPNEILDSQLQSNIGHYLPQHQEALSRTAVSALKYLQSLKPQASKPGPLDKPIPPSRVAIARYNRALDIAQQPASILQRIKDGTLQSTDVQDLNAMYPAMYAGMVMKINQHIIASQAKGEDIPYKTRLSLGLFLGQPLDVSMQPESIVAAQPKISNSPMNQQPQQQSKGRPSALKGKSAQMAQTIGQSAEANNANRD